LVVGVNSATNLVAAVGDASAAEHLFGGEDAVPVGRDGSVCAGVDVGPLAGLVEGGCVRRAWILMSDAEMGVA